MEEVFRGVAAIKGSSPKLFTIIAVYRGPNGRETASQLLGSPLSERAMRKHLGSTGLNRKEIEDAIAHADDNAF